LLRGLFVYDLDLLVDDLPSEAVDRHMNAVTLLSFHDKFSEIRFSRRVASTLRDHVEDQIPCARLAEGLTFDDAEGKLLAEDEHECARDYRRIAKAIASGT
jgi:hypothetical protein